MFYGLTSGTGQNPATSNYPAPIPVKTAVGTGRVPFPQNGVVINPLIRNDPSSFILANAGIYEVTFHVHTLQPGQLQLELNGVDLPSTVAVNMNSTAGGHPISGNSIISTVTPNSILAVINPVGNSTALDIVPSDGASTHANAQTITIKRLL
jgi:hypothetical protein